MLLQTYFIISLYVQVTTAITFISKNRSERDISEVSRCIVDIIEKNTFYKPSLLIKENNIQNSELQNFIETTIIDVIVPNIIPIVSVTSHYYNNKTNYIHDGTLIAIIFIANCKSLINITEVNRNFKYIIILDDHVLIKCNESLHKTAMIIATYDVTLFYKDKQEDTYKLATYFPLLDATTCKSDNNIKFSHINTCTNGSIDKGNINVFPNKKPKDFMRCPLNVGLGSLYPFVKSYNKSLPNLHPLKFVDGSDVQIMKIAANYFNASLNLYHVRTDSENILLELSFISLILNGTLDVCVGGLYRLFGDIVSYSGIYSRQEIIWVYPVHREKRSWLTFTNKIQGLYVFLLFYFCYSAFWIIFSHFDKQTNSFSNTVFYGCGALLGAASLQDARSLKKKILNICYLMLCLHLSAYVSIQLYSFLTIQRPPYVYKDTYDISKSGKPLFMKNKAKYFVDDEKYVAFANTSFDCNDFYDCVRKTMKNKGITAIVDGLLAPIQTATAENDEARILKVTQPILVVYHEMPIRKDSLLAGNFEKFITRLFEAGICQKLYEEAIGILVLDKSRRANRNIISNSYSCEFGCTISLPDSAGAFYVWILGCVVSCCIFCAEITINRKRKSYVTRF